MPYSSNFRLPDNLKHILPDHAQTIYRKAFNSAWDEYAFSQKKRTGSDIEEIAHRVAWASVKNKYKKTNSGKWVKTSLKDK